VARHRDRHPELTLLFHDTHHRAVTQPEALQGLPWESFDGVLAFGQVLKEVYLQRGWHDRVYVWHEAADTRLFRPHPEIEASGDLVWVGNWGDEERSEELQDYLLGPIARLRLQARIHGVRYPKRGLRMLAAAGAEFAGWLPNVLVPETFARYRATVHVPRRAYTRDLPGIPTIRVFEALACGIPLVCAPWSDVEGLFRPGIDYLQARTPQEMVRQLDAVIHDQELAAALSRSGLESIRDRHTCEHRVSELLAILARLRAREVVA
jgi:spore maturation protein CgeB